MSEPLPGPGVGSFIDRGYSLADRAERDWSSPPTHRVDECELRKHYRPLTEQETLSHELERLADAALVELSAGGWDGRDAEQRAQALLQCIRRILIWVPAQYRVDGLTPAAGMQALREEDKRHQGALVEQLRTSASALRRVSCATVARLTALPESSGRQEGAANPLLIDGSASPAAETLAAVPKGNDPAETLEVLAARRQAIVVQEHDARTKLHERNAAVQRMVRALERAKDFPTPIVEQSADATHEALPAGFEIHVADSDDPRWGKWADAYLAAGVELNAIGLCSRLDELPHSEDNAAYTVGLLELACAKERYELIRYLVRATENQQFGTEGIWTVLWGFIRTLAAMCHEDAPDGASGPSQPVPGPADPRPAPAPIGHGDNPFRELTEFAWQIYEEERQRHLAGNKQSRSMNDAAAHINERISRRRQLGDAAMREAHRTGFSIPEVEARIKKLEDACRCVLLWERDAPRPTEEQQRYRETTGCWNDPSGAYLMDQLNGLADALDPVHRLAVSFDGKRDEPRPKGIRTLVDLVEELERRERTGRTDSADLDQWPGVPALRALAMTWWRDLLTSARLRQLRFEFCIMVGRSVDQADHAQLTDVAATLLARQHHPPPYIPSPQDLDSETCLRAQHMARQTIPTTTIIVERQQRENAAEQDMHNAMLKEANNVGQEAKPDPPEESSNAQDATADGPQAPHWLWWKGERTRIGNKRSRLSWLLLNHFWNRDSSHFDDLQGPGMPWPDPVNDSAVTTGVNRFNNAMPDDFPWKLATKLRCVFKQSRQENEA